MDFDTEEQEAYDIRVPSPEHVATVKVFPLLPYLKKDIINAVDSPMSWEHLVASDVHFALVRPLVQKYARLKNMAVVYACLVVRSFFLDQASSDLAHSGVMMARATLCELLALKLLGYFASSKVQIVAVLTITWNPLNGAPHDIVEEVRDVVGSTDDEISDSQSAIEMAIATKSKAFLASPLVQGVVDDMYSGRIVFSIGGTRSILADNYKTRSIQIYDPRAAPLLDHYRLRVPRYSAMLQLINFVTLLVTFLACIWTKDLMHLTLWEVVFVIFAAAFVLREYTSSKEHGWSSGSCHTQQSTLASANHFWARLFILCDLSSLHCQRKGSTFHNPFDINPSQTWSIFNSCFVVIFLAYAGLRVRGLVHHNLELSQLAFDILACGACVLVPRLAFFAVSHNIVILALRAMISEFVFFISIASICFSGLLITLWTLGSDNGNWSLKAIAWLMVQIWFGNTYLSFGQATSFHPVFGPILMTVYAALAGTLLLTILISLLSNTVARIDANATQEYLFQHTISTIDGVKSDALFSYQVPFNLLAFVILKPASYLLPPRELHSANVFLIRLTAFPILLLISMYERHLQRGQKIRRSSKDAAHSFYNSLPRQIKHMPLIEYIVGSKAADLHQAIFDVEETRDFSLFELSDDDEVPPWHVQGTPGNTSRKTGSRQSSRPASRSRSPGRQTGLASLRTQSPVGMMSPRRRKVSLLTPLERVSSNAKMLTIDTSTPLARYFSSVSRPSTSRLDSRGADGEELPTMARLDSLLEESRESQYAQLQHEIRDIQERQTRIESLLSDLVKAIRTEEYSDSRISSRNGI